MANAADDRKRLKLTVFLIKLRYADVHDFMNYAPLPTRMPTRYASLS
jgi:hypothetical protein